MLFCVKYCYGHEQNLLVTLFSCRWNLHERSLNLPYSFLLKQYGNMTINFFLQYLHVPLHTKSNSTIVFWLEFIFNRKLNLHMELSYYDFLIDKPIIEEI